MRRSFYGSSSLRRFFLFNLPPSANSFLPGSRTLPSAQTVWTVVTPPWFCFWVHPQYFPGYKCPVEPFSVLKCPFPLFGRNALTQLLKQTPLILPPPKFQRDRFLLPKNYSSPCLLEGLETLVLIIPLAYALSWSSTLLSTNRPLRDM